VSVPAHPGGQPWTYLSQPLALQSEVSALDPTPAYWFGTGLSYTEFAWSALRVDAVEFATDAAVTVSLEVQNTGARAGTDVVQLYLHDPVASVTRPVCRLIAFARVPLEPGERTRVRFEVPADVTSFVGADLRRIVEPGLLELRLGSSAGDIRLAAAVTMTGAVRTLDSQRERHCRVSVGAP
jgi:beta-xylosidase